MRKSVLVLLQQVGADPGMTRTSYLIETTRAVDSVLGFLKLSRLAAGKYDTICVQLFRASANSSWACLYSSTLRVLDGPNRSF
jgi:hypothetical protein